MTSEGAGDHDAKEHAMRQWSIPTRLTLFTLPIVIVSLLTGLLLAWNLVSYDTTGEFSSNDIWAIVVAVVVGVGARRRAGYRHKRAQRWDPGVRAAALPIPLWSSRPSRKPAGRSPAP